MTKPWQFTLGWSLRATLVFFLGSILFFFTSALKVMMFVPSARDKIEGILSMDIQENLLIVTLIASTTLSILFFIISFAAIRLTLIIAGKLER